MSFSRFDFERAVMGSDLKPGPRHVLHVLATRADGSGGQIPPKFSPSLTLLAAATGMDRRTVERHLAVLASSGWITRTKPTIDKQRQGHRTRYRLHIVAPPRGTTPLGADEPRGTTPPRVGAQCREPSGTTPLNTYKPNKSIAVDRHEQAAEVARGMADIGIDATVAHAMRVMDQVLDRATGSVANPVGYVLAAVKKDPRPFRPTQGPPPVREVLGPRRPRDEWIYRA
jgi:hypothetical protein